MTKNGPKIVVVGAGAFGGWTALHLRRLGADVTLIDTWGPGNSRSSSGGEGRAIRAIYGPDRIYTEMVSRSYELWMGLEKDTGEVIYTETGALWLMQGDDTYVREALPILDDLGFPVEELSLAESSNRFPQIDLTGVTTCFLEQKAGVLLARSSCRLIRDRFVAEGGSFKVMGARPGKLDSGSLSYLMLDDGSTLSADKYVFACGPWLGELFPEVVGNSIRATRQEVYYFGTPAGSGDWAAPSLPVWVDFGERIYYGFPDTHGRGFKIADDTRGAPIDPTTAQREPTPELISAARAYMHKRFPGLGTAPLIEARVCQYSNSPDGHLILDRHPTAENVWLAGGGSGHGFKLSPAVGEKLARAVLEDRALDSKFSLARLSELDEGTTQFEFDKEPE